jgi:hypothetical protein
MDGTPGSTTSTTRPERERDEELPVRCARCGHALTTRKERIEVNGRHGHTFMNPSGVVFDIVCYRAVDGARTEGVPEKETSWFPGTAWVYAHCRGCGSQVGWGYVWIDAVHDDGQRFFGLIVDCIACP